MVYDNTTADIEASLFAAGSAVTLEMLMKVTKKTKAEVISSVRLLAAEYDERGSGIEIVDLGERYVMQIRPSFADRIRSVAPKELTSSQLKTLSIIAYHQPITQSEVVDARGSGAYDHIRDLHERGFIAVRPQGRTKVITTTKVFSDYFGIGSTDVSEIRRKMVAIIKAEGGQTELDRWNARKRIAVSPLYESLMKMCGITDYEVVNPYDPSDQDIEVLRRTDILIMTKGYSDRLNRILDSVSGRAGHEDAGAYGDESDLQDISDDDPDEADENDADSGNGFEFEILEMASTTFDDLIDDIRLLKETLGNNFSRIGKVEKADESVADLEELRRIYREKAVTIAVKAMPATEMAAKLLNDLGVVISVDGVIVAPDYGTSSDGKEIKGQVLIPSHKTQNGTLIKRVCGKYDAVISGLKKAEKKKKQ
ncbi:SMC-Scp complex subunit ScpB [Methanosarcinaceae archaeon]|nr:SMC-Scp complex subunit ScpB [Methanosarcinaceae archaeon]MBQ3620364.1 SMC-Scp complex subunit ScpB [Methanosarcinaceae archaeon]